MLHKYLFVEVHDATIKLVDLAKMKEISRFSQKELSANDFPQLHNLLI